jgi:hydroxylamine dehydrogenase
MKGTAFLILLVFSVGLPGLIVAETAESDTAADKCITCHKEKTPGLYRQWSNSDHAAGGVTCIDCHGAEKEDADGFMHYDVLIATLVTPRDCGQCHEEEVKEVDMSHHARAGMILESADAYLANAAGGYPAAIQGCESCHGARVKLDPESPNKLSMTTWPNSGIGRLNPDGSKGACTACHTRHHFSKAQARQPEACGKCHLGPDHPQKEIYDESKHGNTYYTNIDKMNLESEKWVVGEDYFAAPTCATCHMSATRKQAATHDVGRRISWTLRPNVSVKLEDWQTKRENMKEVCSTCHGPVFVNGHFYQYDASVRLYNEKFARPAGEIMAIVKKNNLLKNRADFSNKIEWVYWELWHHEGRRARHGASMMGPDYTWWHGFYEVAQHFYFKLIPEARELNNPELNAYLDKLLTDDPMHQWLNQPTDRLKQMIKSGELQKVYRSFFEEEKKK